MRDANDKQCARFGKLALRLFVLGLLVPFLIVALSIALPGMEFSKPTTGTAIRLTIGIGIIECLALVFGIIDRKSLYGKIGMIGAIVVLALAIIMAVAVFPNKHMCKALEDIQRSVQNLRSAPASGPSIAL